MQIVITVDNFDELKDVAYTILNKMSPEKPAAPDPEAVPAPAPAPAAEAQQKPAPAAKKQQKTVTRHDVQTKAIALMDAGKQEMLQALLQKYQVPALPSIPEDKLAAFLADLEAM